MTECCGGFWRERLDSLRERTVLFGAEPRVDLKHLSDPALPHWHATITGVIVPAGFHPLIGTALTRRATPALRRTFTCSPRRRTLVLDMPSGGSGPRSTMPSLPPSFWIAPFRALNCVGLRSPSSGCYPAWFSAVHVLLDLLRASRSALQEAVAACFRSTWVEPNGDSVALRGCFLTNLPRAFPSSLRASRRALVELTKTHSYGSPRFRATPHTQSSRFVYKGRDGDREGH